MSNAEQRVVVTGASGFVARHCVQQLLQSGYQVRGTLRSLSKEANLRAALNLDDEANARLSFATTDLLRDEGWSQAMAGATFVLHVASPFPPGPPKSVDDLVKPAKEGTLRVLRAASEAGVKRVVVTSSVAAIFAGHHQRQGRTFTEDDWSDLSANIGAYETSKTLAEQAAWDFVTQLPQDATMELVTINPVFVLGPSLGAVDSTSSEVVAKLLRRDVPGVPRLHTPVVDVRDVARGHLLAMTTPSAAGKRYILSGEEPWFGDIAAMLKEEGYRVPTWVLPNWLVRIVALVDGTVKLVVPELGKSTHYSSDRARQELGWASRPLRETVVDSAVDVSARL